MTQAALPGDEDRKLITLARAARARTQAGSGGAVRDDTGRSYAGADVNLPSLTLTGLEVAVAQAVSAGARGIEGAAVVGDREVPIDVVRDAGGSGVPVWRADRSGAVTGRVDT